MTQLKSDLEMKFQKAVDEALDGKDEIKVLEAGCGSLSHVNFKQDKYFVGIDISKKQLERNMYLKEKILGDIQYYVFPPMCFDAIVCWDVFEHLSEPEKAFDSFVRSIKKDGIIILKLPNVSSLKGLVTKYTPHCFHIFWYRYVYGRNNAGRDDTGPFKTYLKNTISPNHLIKLASQKKLDIILFETFEWPFLEKRNIVIYKVYRTIRAIFNIMSFGKLGDSEILLIMKNRSCNV